MPTDAERSICVLCVASADATGASDSFLYNKRLAETRRFVVIPSVGPFVSGHVMVVSKAHQSSLVAMGRDAVEEYDELADRLRDLPVWSGGTPLEAEHGSTETDKAGACVVHSHVHWIPGMGAHFDELSRRLSIRPEAALTRLTLAHQPYIFLRAGPKQGIFEADGLPSQTIRRLLCDLLERDDLDWRQNRRLDWVTETVDRWARLQGDH